MPKPYSFDLAFRAPRKSNLPGPAIAQISLKHCTRDEGGTFISPNCVTLRELEHEIIRLKRELDMIYAQGKRKFAAFDKRKAE